MGTKISATIDNEKYAELEIWARYHCGEGKRAEYVKRAVYQALNRDRAMWEKTHPVGSTPYDMVVTYQVGSKSPVTLQSVQRGTN